MHANSLQIVKRFIDNYFPDKELKVLDLGSQLMPNQIKLGSYRQFITNKKWSYLGADISAGLNVDVIIESYNFPFKDNEFDFIISGQTIEHMEFPWIWFKELSRILKLGGMCCIVAPAVLHEHKYPIDTYRYYPDGMKALAKWSGLEVVEAKRIRVSDKMEDTYLVARKVKI